MPSHFNETPNDILSSASPFREREPKERIDCTRSTNCPRLTLPWGRPTRRMEHFNAAWDVPREIPTQPCRSINRGVCACRQESPRPRCKHASLTKLWEAFSLGRHFTHLAGEVRLEGREDDLVLVPGVDVVGFRYGLPRGGNLPELRRTRRARFDLGRQLFQPRQSFAERLENTRRRVLLFSVVSLKKRG